MDPSHAPKFNFDNLQDNIYQNLQLPPTSPGTGIIRVDSYPTNTEVYLDGEFLGVTPLSITDVEIGPHQFLIKGMGLQDYSGQIFVNDGSFTPVNAYLQPAYLQPQIPQQIPMMMSTPLPQMQSPQIQSLQTNSQVTVPTNFILGMLGLIVGGLLALAYILRDKK
jgi:hypothetical protein